MRSLLSLDLGSLALFPLFASGFVLPSLETRRNHMRRDVNAQMQYEIASLISGNSSIFTPDDCDWKNATERYMQNINPRVQLSVRPTCESDIPKIVQYANDHNVSFYAVSRGHALTTSVARFEGIEIDLSNLKSISINEGGTTAHFQGGVYSQEAIIALWNQGYVTATGTCSCVSVLGPALGGGHGLQQGKHGLTMDHLVNLNVVLANGTTISVNETSYPDLWWGMRGAGHNFGIVTSYDTKIWPDNFKTYYVKTYQYGSSSLEPLIEQVKLFQGNGTLSTDWLASFGLYTMNTTLSETEATIYWVFLYDGMPSPEAKARLEPFDALSPLSMLEEELPYTHINDPIGGSIDGSLCEPDKTHIIGTSNLVVYNASAMRAIYDLYNDKIRQHPNLGGTRMLVEGYAMKGVQSLPSDDSAFPFRADNILTYFDVKFNRSDDPLIDFATTWRDETVALWNSGQPDRTPTTYVNYAAGYESLEARYGFEPWRLDRLRALKAQYDPTNKFAWYNPIIPPVATY